MSDRYYWAKDEVDMLQDPNFKLYENQEKLKQSLTHFMLSGLKTLGYTESFKSLKEESGMGIREIFSEEMKVALIKLQFEEVIQLFEQKNIMNEQISQSFKYAILRLKYVKSVIDKDTEQLVKMLRVDLRPFPEFEQEKRDLSGLYLTKTKEEVYSRFGVNLEDPASLVFYANKLEFRLLSKENRVAEPFDFICKNNLSYQLINCKYHKPYTLISKDGLKSFQGMEIEGGMYHKCELDYIPKTVYQKINDATDELWDVKLSSDCETIFVLTRDRIIMAFQYDEPSKLYKHLWASEKSFESEVLSWTLNDKYNTILLTFNDKSIKIVCMEKGENLTTINENHNDNIYKIHSVKSGEEFLTGSTDGKVKVWDYKHCAVKEDIDTAKVLDFLLASNEEDMYIIYSNNRFVDKHNLVENTKETSVIVENENILASCLSPSDEYMLLSTGPNIVELHLWRLSDYSLLNKFVGHVQSKYHIGCAFLTDYVICSGSEDGCLLYWHINDRNPVEKLELHNTTLNNVVTGFNVKLNKTIVVTVSDDYSMSVLV